MLRRHVGFMARFTARGKPRGKQHRYTHHIYSTAAQVLPFIYKAIGLKYYAYTHYRIHTREFTLIIRRYARESPAFYCGELAKIHLFSKASIYINTHKLAIYARRHSRFQIWFRQQWPVSRPRKGGRDSRAARISACIVRGGRSIYTLYT